MTNLNKKNEVEGNPFEWVIESVCFDHLQSGEWTIEGCPICAASRENKKYVNAVNEAISLRTENESLRQENERLRKLLK